MTLSPPRVYDTFSCWLVAQVRKLDVDASEEPLPLGPFHEVFVFSKVKDVRTQADGVYCLPKVHNFPAIDALLQPHSLFQMTISQKRSMRAEWLDQAKRQLRGGPKRLYFVVPDCIFSSFSLVPGLARDVEQWVLKI